MKRAGLVLGTLLLLAAAAAAGSKAKEQYASLTVTVVNEETGKPLRNAAVVLHELDKNGRLAAGGLELKTDAEGQASLNSLPYGKLRLQVVMPKFQTYGEDFMIDQPEQQIVVKLKRPQPQYSIYK